MAQEAASFQRMRKDRILLQISSLKDSDDERTSISKRISWILRHGSKTAGVAQEPRTKWVKFTDLCESEILKEFTQDLIWAVIVEFNRKKLRYELEGDGPGPQTRVRAARRGDDPSSEHPATDMSNKEKVFVEISGKVGGRTGLRKDATEFVPWTSPAAGQAALAAAVPPFAPSPPVVMAPSVDDPIHQAILQAQMAAASKAAGFEQLPEPAPFGNRGYNPTMPPKVDEFAEAGQHTGRIKSLNEKNGFGFIECKETLAQYGRDVFLHKSQAGDLPLGSAVTFYLRFNKQDMPQAWNVQPIVEGAARWVGVEGGMGGEEGGKASEGPGGQGDEKGEDERGAEDRGKASEGPCGKGDEKGEGDSGA